MVTILVQRYAHTPARLSPYFATGILRPRLRSERGRFFFPMVALLRDCNKNQKEFCKMVNSIKMWFDGARRFVRGWRRCRLFGDFTYGRSCRFPLF